MLAFVRSRLNVKLTITLAATLCLVLGGLAAVYISVVNTLMAEQDARASLLREMNDELRAQVFDLQNKLTNVPEQLQTDPLPGLLAWARDNHETETRTFVGRDEIVARFEKRGERRDLQKPGRIVVKEDKGGVGIAFGRFDGDTFTDTVDEILIKGADPTAVAEKAQTMMESADDPNALERKVAELNAILIDEALAAELTRNAMLEQVDVLRALEAEVEATQTNALVLIIAISVAGVVVANLAVWGVMRMMVTRSLSRLSVAIRAIADDENAQITDTERSDEIGALAEGVGLFKRALNQIADMRVQQEAERAARERNLSERLTKLSNSLETGMGSRVTVVTESVEQLVGIAGELNALAADTLSRSTESHALAEECATFINDVRSVVQNLNTTSQRIAAEVRTQRSLTGEVATEADAVTQTVTELAETAKRIGGVVTLIQDIAEQTNLLALNATIEAARAGDAGRGFAVVASEVKTLSGQTAEATVRISEQVKEFRASIDRVSTAAGMIQERLRTVDTGMIDVAGGIETLSRETGSITGTVEDVADRANRVAGVNEGVASAAEKTGSMSGTMSESSNRIIDAVVDMHAHLRQILEIAASGTRSAA